MLSIHRLRRGLLGYLIPFAPHAFVHWVSELSQHIAFAFDVLADINGFNPYTSNSMCLFQSLVYPSLPLIRGWAPRFNRRCDKPPTDALRPMNPDNAWGPRITAAAGTRLAAPYSTATIIVFSQLKVLYTPRGFFIHAASLLQAFAHWGRFLTAASRRSLGSVSVPVSGAMLSHPIPVVALVGHYLTN